MKPFLQSLLRSGTLLHFWTQVHRLSLIGMNYWASDLNATGELRALAELKSSILAGGKAVVFDVGANVGCWTLACDNILNRRAKLFCFEPSHATSDMLEINLGEITSRTQIVRLGLSDVPAEANLYSSEPGSTIASVYNLDRPIRPMKEEFREVITLTTLDKFCENNGIESISFLKLDIEGHELAALRGATRMLSSRTVGYIQFEFGEANVDSRTYLRDFWDLLHKDYDFFQITPKRLVPWTYDGGRSEIFATMNYVCKLRNDQAGFSRL